MQNYHPGSGCQRNFSSKLQVSATPVGGNNQEQSSVFAYDTHTVVLSRTLAKKSSGTHGKTLPAQ